MTGTDAIVAAIHEHVEHMRGYTLPALAPGFLDGYGHALGLVERDAGFIADAIVAAVTARAHAPIWAALTRGGQTADIRCRDAMRVIGDPAAATQHDTDIARQTLTDAVPLASERLGLALVQAVVDSDWLAEHDQRVRDRAALGQPHGQTGNGHE